MWTRKLLKDNAKIAFKRNYWSCVLVCILAGFLGGSLVSNSSFSFNTDGSYDNQGTTDVGEMFAQIDPVVWIIMAGVFMIALLAGLMIAIWVSNVAAVGCARYFMENREHKTKVSQLFYGFQRGRYLQIVKVMFLKGLYIFLWSLLFSIPGIIKTYSYMLVPYILAENPDLDSERVFKLSRKMMKGHKMDAFILEMSFIGWHLLSACTFGLLNIFYVSPYVNATHMEFYSLIKADAVAKGLIAEGELPGVALPEVTVPEETLPEADSAE